MFFDIKKESSDYTSVKLFIDSTSVDIGMLDSTELKGLVAALRLAADELNSCIPERLRDHIDNNENQE